MLDEVTISSMNMFEMITHVPPIDCVMTENTALFIVKKGYLRKCIGRNGNTLKKLRERLNRNVWIVEYSDNIEEFIKGLMSNIQINSITERDNVVYVSVPLRHRGFAIGKNGEIIKRNREIIKRLYDKELKIVAR